MPTNDVPFDPDLLFVEMAQALSSREPHPWHDLERGEISLVTFNEYVEAQVPGASALFAADSSHNVMANLHVIPDHLALAHELKARGFRVGLVTNNVAEWEPHWLPRLPEGLFEVVIDSAAVGLRKPEAGIYQLALQRMEIDNPNTVLFIDDFEWNVQGAENVGMIGMHHTSATDLPTAVFAALSQDAQY